MIGRSAGLADGTGTTAEAAVVWPMDTNVFLNFDENKVAALVHSMVQVVHC